MNETFMFSLASLVSAAGVWVWWFCFRRPYLLDLFRQRVFDIRDGLFLYCAENRIGFDHKAYTELRTIQNGLIRYAERLSMWTLISANVFRDETGRKGRHSEELEEAIKTLPTEEARKVFEMAHITTVFVIVDYIARNSILVMALSSVVIFVLKLSKYFGRYLLAGVSKTDSVRKDFALLVPGVHEIEEEAAKYCPAAA